MERQPVESSLLRSAGYDPASSILEVELIDGRIYEYFDVPYSAFDELVSAESRGAYYNDFIKDLYAYRRVDPAGEADPSDDLFPTEGESAAS